MTDSLKSHNYAQSLTMPVNKMPMKASQPELERLHLDRWRSLDLYNKLRDDAAGRPKFVLHDGPPYANGNTHIGHTLNKVLKDVVVRSRQMQGFDAPYVPGWDCHGLPIEWKVEEQYRADGVSKNDVSAVQFRTSCREFAAGWVSLQAQEFERLGVCGDFENPYTTMSFKAEAAIAGELLKLVKHGLVYRGAKPVMWSVVERTSLADAEVEYLPYESETAWVKFPVAMSEPDLNAAFVVVWTSTPWTLPANRAVAFSSAVEYSLYEVQATEREFGPQVSEQLLLADRLVELFASRAKLTLSRLRSVSADELAKMRCHHPLKAMGYDFPVPLLAGEHVTDDAGTGFVHTAPGHGREDYELWQSYSRQLRDVGIDVTVPCSVDDAGFLTDAAPGFGPSSESGAARVYDDAGERGDANARVMEALKRENMLVMSTRLKHEYPHSWRSKKPVIFRNTPQWFVSMDEAMNDGPSLRSRALKSLEDVQFVPQAGRDRLVAMVDARPDWVLSRQRKWGVPVVLFVDERGHVLHDEVANQKVLEAFEAEGADVWFADGAKLRFLGHREDVDRWNQVMDILDVWFDSGCTQGFVLEGRPELQFPADVYLEGSDQHRGWFQSSLLVGCATRGRAPYKAVVTHGFVMAENGKKMAKSDGNGLSPKVVVDRVGADVLRLWALTCDYHEDVRFGETYLKVAQETFRKLRNTLRWMEGMLHHFNGVEVPVQKMSELERLMLHRLFEIDVVVRKAYADYDFKAVLRVLSDFMNHELSAFYFDVRKDALYCDPPSSIKRQASLQVLAYLFEHVVVWLAPCLPFLAEEAWLAVCPEDTSVHLKQFPVVPLEWNDPVLDARWQAVSKVRSVVNTCLEVERKAKRIGKPSDARPVLYLSAAVFQDVSDLPLAEVCLTSGLDVVCATAPEDAFRLSGVEGVAVEFRLATGQRCARSWLISDDVGIDPDYPDVSPRDAAALREIAWVPNT